MSTTTRRSATTTSIKSDPERYFGSFQGDPAEYWYGPGFLKFVQQLEEAGNYKRANNKMAVILSAGVYAANIANAIKEKAAEYRLGDQPVRDRERADLGMGPDAGQDPPGPAGASSAVTHFLPADLAQFMVQFAPNPTNSLVYMQYGPSIPAFREIAKEASNGVLYATVVGALQDEIGTAFETALQGEVRRQCRAQLRRAVL